jgi:hypothetical protein
MRKWDGRCYREREDEKVGRELAQRERMRKWGDLSLLLSHFACSHRAGRVSVLLKPSSWDSSSSLQVQRGLRRLPRRADQEDGEHPDGQRRCGRLVGRRRARIRQAALRKEEVGSRLRERGPWHASRGLLVMKPTCIAVDLLSKAGDDATSRSSPCPTISLPIYLTCPCTCPLNPHNLELRTSLRGRLQSLALTG